MARIKAKCIFEKMYRLIKFYCHCFHSTVSFECAFHWQRQCSVRLSVCECFFSYANILGIVQNVECWSAQLRNYSLEALASFTYTLGPHVWVSDVFAIEKENTESEWEWCRTMNKSIVFFSAFFSHQIAYAFCQFSSCSRFYLLYDAVAAITLIPFAHNVE